MKNLRSSDPRTRFLSRLVTLRSGLLCGLLALIPFFLGAPAAGQVTTAVIEGTVSDAQGLRVAGAEVVVEGPGLASAIRVKTDANGAYHIAAIPPGDYKVTISREGFRTKTFEHVTLLVNQAVTFNMSLELGTVGQTVSVTAEVPLIERTISSSGSTITPQQIEQTPLNGRNYLDLLQLVPGVAINRQVDPTLDASTPILGERGGNAIFLIDGLPNRNEVNGGAAAQFNQDSIMEFQVLTSGYKAEFGHGSGGIINVLSKSGTNALHGGVSFYHRNYKLDSSDNSLNTPFLLRYDPTIYLGGPVIKDKVFFFGSIERIRESRDLNFVFPSNIPQVLQDFEAPFDLHSQTYETRGRFKLDEQVGRHRLSEQLNMTNNHITDYLPLTQALNLPDTRSNISTSTTMFGISDLVMLGDQSNPFALNGYFQYRREPYLSTPSHQNGNPAILFNLFSSLDTGQLFGDQGQVTFGPGHTPLSIKPDYETWGASLGHLVNRHNWKFGWDGMHMHIDGTESENLFNQLFATVADFQQFGPDQSGVYFLSIQKAFAPGADQIKIRNVYNGLFVQDDWKIHHSVTLNLGLRWDYDSSFPSAGNVSPRLGVAWAINPKTVVNASWGIFYDHFRLGLARDIPQFGGANITGDAVLSFPRLFYGDPSFVSVAVGGPCLASDLTDAQIAAQKLSCPFANEPYYGIDHLNSVVAPGHAPIPANVPLTISNVQSLTGFTPQQFADAASVAIGKAAGYLGFDQLGNLSTDLVAGTTIKFPITVDQQFRTPYTRNLHLGVQRQLTDSMALSVDYFHKDIRHILGVRATNLAFEARLNGHLAETTDGKPITETYGPWYSGQYDGLTFDFRKRMTHSFSVELSYTYAHQTDNALNSSFVSDVQAGGSGVEFTSLSGPTDSFVGTVPVVTDPVTGQTNAKGAFVVSGGNAVGNPVPKAGTFYNGANLDKGPSDLSVPHTFFAYGIWQLPWKVDISGIFRVQSGFRYSRTQPSGFTDVDGDNIFNGLDWVAGRNHFEAPSFANLDMRVAKRFSIGDRVKAQLLLEYFNILNRNNPAAIQTLAGQPVPFGGNLQVLPGREGQVGIRFDF